MKQSHGDVPMPHLRRGLRPYAGLGAAALIALAALAGTASAAASPATPEATDGRPSAPFRVLFSNDATNITSCPSPWNPEHGPFRKEYLLHSVDETAGTGIDVHLLQPGLGWVPWWQSDVYPMAEHVEFLARVGRRPSSWEKFVLAGGDVVQTFVARCRERGLTAFVSVRMNDAHHIFRNDEIADPKRRADAMAVCRFYHEHPEFRMGERTQGYPWYPYVLDWSHQEVRDYKFRLIDELCRKYDFDGLELDFMRHPKYFRLDRTTAAQRAAILAGFVQRVRRVLDATAKPGARRWLCVRVPPYVETHADVGIDLRALADAGVDMVNVAPHYFTVMTSDVAAIRRMLPERVRVYHELHYATVVGPPAEVDGRKVRTVRRTTPQQFYTAAHLTYARGGDGISTFNFHYYRGARPTDVYGPPQEPPFRVLRHLGDPDWLARQPQHYIVGRTGSAILDHAQAHMGRHFRLPVKEGEPMRLTLDMAPPTGGWKEGGRLRLQAARGLGTSEWEARLNGARLEPTDDVSEPYPNPYKVALGEPADYRAWIVPARLCRAGANLIEITLTKGKPVRLCCVDLAIR